MEPEYHNQLNAWCSEEVDALKAKGATDEDLKAPAFARLVLRTVLENTLTKSEQIRGSAKRYSGWFLKKLPRSCGEPGRTGSVQKGTSKSLIVSSQ